MSPLKAVVTHTVQIKNYFSFEPQREREKRGLKTDADPDTVTQCLCAEALPKFLTKLVSLRRKYPEQRILISKADASDAFGNVRVDPDEAHNFCTR